MLVAQVVPPLVQLGDASKSATKILGGSLAKVKGRIRKHYKNEILIILIGLRCGENHVIGRIKGVGPSEFGFSKADSNIKNPSSINVSATREMFEQQHVPLYGPNFIQTKLGFTHVRTSKYRVSPSSMKLGTSSSRWWPCYAILHTFEAGWQKHKPLTSSLKAACKVSPLKELMEKVVGVDLFAPLALLSEAQVSVVVEGKNRQQEIAEVRSGEDHLGEKESGGVAM